MPLSGAENTCNYCEWPHKELKVFGLGQRAGEASPQLLIDAHCGATLNGWNPERCSGPCEPERCSDLNLS
jgi:hypothetical protein